MKMFQEIVDINGIDITFLKSDRAKRVNITIKPFKGVIVSVPILVSFYQAKKFVKQKINWIESSLSKIKKNEDKLTIFTVNTEFKTRSHILNIYRCDVLYPESIIRAGKIDISVPIDCSLSDLNIQKEIRVGIEKALRQEAKTYLPNRVNSLANKHRFKFNNLVIKNTKTRWGSCSYLNNINLSLHLMRLPDHLIDYVILHELVHTKVKNHSIDFWQLLDTVSVGAKLLDKELRRYNIVIY